MEEQLAYQVKLEVFEGPFDLLLSLITKQKLDIYDVSLTAITRDYLEYLDKMKSLDLEIASEFLVIAATLLQIKAGSLLSSEQEEEEQEVSATEAREILIARLLEYKKFKNASEKFLELMQNQRGFCKRKGELEKRILARTDFLEGVTKEDLAYSLVSLLLNKGSNKLVVQTDHILVPPINLSEKTKFVLERLQVNSCETFRNLTKHCQTKIEVAVTFLALLELYRRRVITLRQTETFGEIRIELTKEVEQLPAIEQYVYEDTTKDTNA
jgi:segregation and condensation protein A